MADEPSRATRNLVVDAYLCKPGCGRFAIQNRTFGTKRQLGFVYLALVSKPIISRVFGI